MISSPFSGRKESYSKARDTDCDSSEDERADGIQVVITEDARPGKTTPRNKKCAKRTRGTKLPFSTLITENDASLSKLFMDPEVNKGADINLRYLRELMVSKSLIPSQTSD